MDESKATPATGGPGDPGKQPPGGRVERMPLAYITGSWFQGRWDYADNHVTYWLVEDGETATPMVERAAIVTLTPGFFSLSGGGSHHFATREPIPDDVADDLDGAALARWMAGAFDERKRLGDEGTWDECAPFDERDWLALLNAPAIKRWNRKRKTGFAGGPPSCAERAEGIARLTRGIEGLSDMRAMAVVQSTDVWDDGFRELDRKTLERRFGPGCSCFYGSKQIGLLEDLVVVDGSGNAFCYLATHAPIIGEDGYAQFLYLVRGDPEPVAPDALESILPEKGRWDIAEYLN